MRLGFHTNAFGWAGEKNLLDVASFAKEKGFDFLEVGPTFPLDKTVFKKALEYVDIDAFCFCRNFCSDNRNLAEKERKELYERMKFASEVGAKRVVISTGISESLSKTDHGGCNPLSSLNGAVEFLEEALEEAERYGIEVALENCPMERNIATSPFMIRKIFERIPHKGLGLAYDPSHNVWQYMDVYEPLVEFGERIHHIHLKDTKVFEDKVRDLGIMHNTASDKGFDENQWWRHCIVGDGDVDWKKFFSMVKGVGGEVSLSIEMEDFNYEGDVEKVKESLTIQKGRIEGLAKELGL